MNGKIEQRVCIKFCVKLSKSATETLEILREAFGEHSLSQIVAFKWHSCRVSVEDDESSGQPSSSKMTENAEKIREPIQEDCCRTIHDLTDTVLISYGVCKEILTEYLNMYHIAANFVRWLMTNNQKQQSLNVCLEL
jgi:hypothetical protein